MTGNTGQVSALAYYKRLPEPAATVTEMQQNAISRQMKRNLTRGSVPLSRPNPTLFLPPPKQASGTAYGH